jgi:hypothetical protein
MWQKSELKEGLAILVWRTLGSVLALIGVLFLLGLLLVLTLEIIRMGGELKEHLTGQSTSSLAIYAQHSATFSASAPRTSPCHPNQGHELAILPRTKLGDL